MTEQELQEIRDLVARYEVLLGIEDTHGLPKASDREIADWSGYYQAAKPLLDHIAALEAERQSWEQERERLIDLLRRRRDGWLHEALRDAERFGESDNGCYVGPNADPRGVPYSCKPDCAACEYNRQVAAALS